MTSADSVTSLHSAFGYIPKRVLRFFLENKEERISSLIQGMEEVFERLEHYEEVGSDLLFHGMMILAALHREEGLGLLHKIGRLSSEQVDAFLGENLFDSLPVAIAELYKDRIGELKRYIEDVNVESSIRASSLQAMMVLFGQKRVTRDELIPYFRFLWEHRVEKIPYFYDVLASASMALHPGELIDQIRAAYKEGFVDEKQISQREVEEVDSLTKEEVIANAQNVFSADLSDLIGHLTLALKGNILFERNDPCPCDSGLKFKKCCQ